MKIINIEPSFSLKAIFEPQKIQLSENEKRLVKYSSRSILYVDKGIITLSSNNQHIKIDSGTIYFASENSTLRITCSSDCSILAIGYECIGKQLFYLDDNYYKLNSFEKTLLAYLEEQAFLLYNETVNERFTRKSEINQLVKSNLELIFTCVLVDQSGKNPDLFSYLGTEKNDTVVSQILELLNEHVYDDISIKEISEKLFFSETYIRKIFKERVGENISNYFNNLKIIKAKELISLRKYSINEISVKLGFSSMNYFSSVFKKYTGMLPTEYKNSISSYTIK